MYTLFKKKILLYITYFEVSSIQLMIHNDIVRFWSRLNCSPSIKHVVWRNRYPSQLFIDPDNNSFAAFQKYMSFKTELFSGGHIQSTHDRLL